MNHQKLGRFCLGLLAALALCAIAAPTASAIVEDKFRSSFEPTVMTAANEEPITLGINAGKAKWACKKSNLSGTFPMKVAAEIETFPTFKECPATFDREGCVIRLSGRTNDNNDAAIELGCPPGKEMTFTTELCNVQIPAQTLEGVSYVNGTETVGGVKRKDVTIKVTVTAMIYEKVPVKALGCAFLGGAGEGKDGTLTGAYTATGYEDFSPPGPPVNEDEYIEGNVVDFEVE